MSYGMGANENLVAADEKTVIYEYGNYNLNDLKYRNEEHLYDGIITIQRDCFAEPEIHEKLKKMPSGRKKLIVKRVRVYVNYGEMLLDGRIVIENCSNCWQTIDEGDIKVDAMAFRVLSKIFDLYQEEGKIPEKISYNL